MNKKDQRIIKLHQAGLSVEQIARKIGNPQGTERVLAALERNKKNVF